MMLRKVIFLLFCIASTFLTQAISPEIQRYEFRDSHGEFNVDTAASRLNIELGVVSSDRSRFGGTKPMEWSMRWNQTTGYYDFIRISESKYQIHETYSVVVGRYDSGRITICDSVCMNRALARYPDAVWVLFSWSGSQLDIYCGSDNLHRVMTVSCAMPDKELCSLYGSGVCFDSVVVESWPLVPGSCFPVLTEEEIRLRIPSDNTSVEGIWEYFDRDTDDARARIGGRYRLGIVRSDDADSYLIIYLGGAVVNGARWTEGMIKGRLIPTAFKDQYQLLWYDSAFDEVEADVDAYAALENSSLLSLSFPLYNTQFRLARCIR